MEYDIEKHEWRDCDVTGVTLVDRFPDMVVVHLDDNRTLEVFDDDAIALAKHFGLFDDLNKRMSEMEENLLSVGNYIHKRNEQIDKLLSENYRLKCSIADAEAKGYTADD